MCCYKKEGRFSVSSRRTPVCADEFQSNSLLRGAVMFIRAGSSLVNNKNFARRTRGEDSVTVYVSNFEQYLKESSPNMYADDTAVTCAAADFLELHQVI